jgi:hypothetical protein
MLNNFQRITKKEHMIHYILNQVWFWNKRFGDLKQYRRGIVNFFQTALASFQISDGGSRKDIQFLHPLGLSKELLTRSNHWARSRERRWRRLDRAWCRGGGSVAAPVAPRPGAPPGWAWAPLSCSSLDPCCCSSPCKIGIHYRTWQWKIHFISYLITHLIRDIKHSYTFPLILQQLEHMWAYGSVEMH